MSPRKALVIVKAQVETNSSRILDALAVRLTTALAGSAIVTTTTAICEVIKIEGFYDVCITHGR